MKRTSVLIALVLAMSFLPAQRAAALENEDLLSLVAMPLAVAAVSELTDVPMNQLMDVVTLLNDALVPPAQFVEVVRYVPVAFVVDDTGNDFVDFIRLREQEGIRGTALVTSIEERINTVYDIPSADLDIVRPRVIDVVETEFVPTVVRTRIAEVRRVHPHGGPPGQLKKAAGVQTGAEIVHQTNHTPVVRNVVRKEDRPEKHMKVEKVEKVEKHEKHEAKHEAKHDDGGHGKGHGHGQGGKKGKG